MIRDELERVLINRAATSASGQIGHRADIVD